MNYEDEHITKLQNCLHEIVETGMTSVMRSLTADIETRMTSAKRVLIADINRKIKMLFQQNAVPRRELKLQFKNKISQTILTGEEIKGEGDTSIEIILIDTCTKQVVDMGPEASARVEIAVLKGDEFDACGDSWFNDNIVPVELGKLPLLAGDILIKLESGKGVVNGIKFRNHTVKMNQNKLRLGARFVDSFEGIQVREAKTEVFTVKDFRNKYNRKHDVPSLADEVWRLKNIQRGGKIDERLCKVKIVTVEGFLTQLLINPEELKETVKLPAKKWEATMNHARTCPIDQRRYCYINFPQRTGIVFDRLGNVLGLILEGRYTSANTLSREDKVLIEKLMSSATENWKDTHSFDNEIELQHHLSLFTSTNPHSSFQHEHNTGPQAGPTGCVQLKSSEWPVPGVESAHNHPQDCFGPVHTGLLDKPGPPTKKLKSLQSDEGTSSRVASGDQLGPCGVSNECFHESVLGVGGDISSNGFSYEQSVEYPLQDAPLFSPDYAFHMQFFDNDSEI